MVSIYNNSTISENSTFSELKWSLRTISVLITCSIITILTILGNGLVLISIKFRLRTLSYSDYFIVSLCLADFFVGLFVMPLMTTHSLHLRWPYDYRLCYVWMSIDFTCSTASFLTLASMALDRYWALTAPYFHLRNRSYSSVLIFIIASWTIPFAIWPSSIFISHYYSTSQPTCVHPAPPFIIVGLCTFFYYIPLLFMLACYSRIIVNIKNIEVLIKDTSDSIDSHASTSNGSKPSGTIKALQVDESVRQHKDSSATTTTTTPLSSIRFQCYKYLHRNKIVKTIRKESLSTNEKRYVIQEVTEIQNSNGYRHNIGPKRRSNTIIQGTAPNFTTASRLSPSPFLIARRRSSRPTTITSTTPSINGTFKGQKRSYNVVVENNRLKKDLTINEDDEQQRLVRACMKTYRLSLPTIRYESCYYYQSALPARKIITKAIIEDQKKPIANDHKCEKSRQNSVTTEQSPSQAASSGEGHGSGTVKVANASKHDSSFDITMDEENCLPTCRNRPLGCSSKPRSSSRYSQRAIAEFMHERRKACLKRNQKASRMLGILLAVFLICWLPFTISYPTSIFFPTKFPSVLESIIFWLGYANSMLNPFLYVYSSRHFRQAIIETLCCHTRLYGRHRLQYHGSLRTSQR